MPVMMERLLGFVNDGMADVAVAWNPDLMNDERVGRMLSSHPACR